MEEKKLGQGSEVPASLIVPRHPPRGLDRRSRYRRNSAERRKRRPWVRDLADRRSGKDRRARHRRSGLDRRSRTLRLRDGGLAAQAMAFLAGQAEDWLNAAGAAFGSGVPVRSNALA